MSTRPPRLRDIADRLGVHVGTVSRALNPRTRALVNPETAERIIELANELGYQPNPVARGLKTARTSTVGVVIPDLTNPFFPPIVRGIEDALRPAGYTALVANTDNDPDMERALVASLRTRRVDGLIFATARLDRSAIPELARAGVPLVLVNRRSRLRIPTVRPDDAAGLAEAVRHVYEHGHRAIAHVAGPHWTSTGRDRLVGFNDALRQCGVPPDPRLVVEGERYRIEAGYRATAELAARGQPFTAIVAGNDMLALGCYRWLAEHRLRIPRDVSVTGFNNMPLVDLVAPPLTTVAVPHYELGVAAGQLMLRRIEEPQARAQSMLLPTRLVVRASVGPPKLRG